jgi:hypothetical protein
MIVSDLEQFVIEAQQKDNALYLVLQRGVSNFKVSWINIYNFFLL